MDFVISKVVMAICALLVVVTVSGLFTDGAIIGGDHGFEHVLDEFCDLASRAASGESSMAWQVPFLADGEGVTLSIHNGTVLVESAYGAAARQPSFGIHLWHPDGRALNGSAVASLDRSEATLALESGQTVEIVTIVVMYENEQTPFVFVYAGD